MKLLSHFAMRAIFLCFFIISFFAGINAGFSSGVLVKTTSAYIPIEQIVIGDVVACYNEEQASYVQASVTHVGQHVSDAIILIACSEITVHAAPDQKFYLPLENRWCDAHALVPGQFLLRYGGELVEIVGIAVINERTTMFDITVTPHHTFCVSPHGIIVHNIVFAVPLLSWGAGIAWFEGVTLAKAAIALATAAACVLIGKKTGIHVHAHVSADGTMNGKALPGTQSHHQQDDCHNPTVSTTMSDGSGGVNGGGPCPCGHLCGVGCSCGCFCGCGRVSDCQKNDFKNFEKSFLEHVLKDARFEQESQKSIQYIKSGNFNETLKDFEDIRKISPDTFRDLGEGRVMVILPDGTKVIARPLSSGIVPMPTLEIQMPNVDRVVKIRYMQ